MKASLITGVAALAALVVSCSSASVPPPNAVQARYEPAAGAVQVVASSLKPISDAELIAPDGRQYRTVALTLLSGPHVVHNPPPAIGIGIGGFGFTNCCVGIGSGLGLTMPLGSPTPVGVSDQYVTLASIPAPADYPRNWPTYRIRVQLGDHAMLLNAPSPG
jgi:hypothetical protein